MALPVMLKAALPLVPGVNLLPGVRRTGDTLPALTLGREDVAVSRADVAAYAEVCGFPLAEALPLAYPHLLAFGLQMDIMTHRSFPFPAVGTVHLENSITRHRAVTAGERFDVTCHPGNLRPHPKGRVFDLVTSISSGGEVVWDETSTYLRLGRGSSEAPASALEPVDVVPSSGTTWRLPGDLGRRYASVSGDHNPIHLYALTAKAFGFKRQIAHGMWSEARCLAALDGRLPDAVTVQVAFKKPLLLPGTAAFGSRRTERGYDFSLTSTSGAPHLVGRTVTPA